MNLSDYTAMSNDALTAYLFGLAVDCPIGLKKCECPLLELRNDNLPEVYDLLQGLAREEKLRLAARHYGCAEWKEARLAPLAQAR